MSTAPFWRKRRSPSPTLPCAYPAGSFVHLANAPAGALSPMCGHLPSSSVASCLLNSRAVRAPALRFLCCSYSLLLIPTTIRQSVPCLADFRQPALGLLLSISPVSFFFPILLLDSSRGDLLFCVFVCLTACSCDLLKTGGISFPAHRHI